MLLCLDYAANYNEKVRLPPPNYCVYSAVDTYYSAVGILDELKTEEMEEVFQKSLAESKKTETA